MENLVFGFFAVLFPFGLFGIFILIAYTGYQDKQHAKGTWRQLAAANKLTFVEGNYWDGGAYVVGDYRGHHLKLDTYEKSQGKTSVTYTRLFVLPYTDDDHFLTNKLPLGEPLTVDSVTHLLTVNLPASLNGKLTVQDTAIYYEHYGVESNVNYLQRLFDLMTDLADGYPKVLTLGGEAVPALYAIATTGDHPLKHVAAELLKDIGQQTTSRLRDRAAHLFCPRCLTSFGEHTLSLHWWQFPITYYGCRLCGQSREFVDGWVVAKLDSGMSPETFKQDGVLRVNWLTRRALFDFDEVQIVQATDEDVERFAVQVGNDTDPARKPRYEQMRCVVSPECGLSENTMRILGRMFGDVAHSEGESGQRLNASLQAAGGSQAAGNLRA